MTKNIEKYEDYEDNDKLNILYAIVLILALLCLAYKNPTWGLIGFFVLWTVGFLKVDDIVANKNE